MDDELQGVARTFPLRRKRAMLSGAEFRPHMFVSCEALRPVYCHPEPPRSVDIWQGETTPLGERIYPQPIKHSDGT